MADEDTTHLKKADDAAFLEWAQKVHKRRRKPEGEFAGATGKITPTARETTRYSANGGARTPDIRPVSPRTLQSWGHVYSLCLRARLGGDVPPDIAESFKKDYGPINAARMGAAVDAALKRESDAHEARERVKRAQEKALAARSTEARLAKQQAKVKRLNTRIKYLETLRAKTNRSVSALERSLAKKDETT